MVPGHTSVPDIMRIHRDLIWRSETAVSRLFPWLGDRTRIDERSRIAPERAQAMLQEAGEALDRKDLETAGALFVESIAIFHARSMGREEADALHAYAQMLVSKSDYPAAFEAYSRAIALYRKHNLRGQLAVTLRDAGYASSDRGDVEQAHVLLTESLALFELTADKCGMASALEGLGIAAQEQQDYQSAREYLQRSLALHRDLDLNAESAVSLIYLSIVALTQCELDTAEALYRESIDRFREDNPDSSLIPPLLTIGDVAFTTQDSVQIAELLQAALSVFGASRLKRSWDSAMIKLGGVAQRRHVNRSALETYRHSLSVDPARDEWGSEAIACLGLGCVAYRQDKPKIGKALVARSLNLCRTHGDSETILYVLCSAAAYTYRCQHYPDSCQYHLQSADAARSSGDHLQAADALCYAGFLACWLGLYEEARKSCVEAVSLYRKQGLASDTARAQSLLGTIFCNLDDSETGTKIHEEAVATCRQLADPIATAVALSGFAESLTRCDRDRARACLEESLELQRLHSAGGGVEAEMLHNLAEVNRLDNQHADAYQMFCRSLELKLADADRFGYAVSLFSAGLIAVESRQFEVGAMLLCKAESIRRCLGMPVTPRQLEEANAARGRLEEELGHDGYARIQAKADTMTLAAIGVAARSIRELIIDPEPEVESESDNGENEDEELVEPDVSSTCESCVLVADEVPLFVAQAGGQREIVPVESA